MKLKIISSNRFRKDLRLVLKRQKDPILLCSIITKLSNREQLPPKNYDHDLSGDFTGFRECHIQPDWLLIYRIDDDSHILFLSRTGSHSDLF